MFLIPCTHQHIRFAFCCQELIFLNKADKSASNSLNPSIFEGLVTLCAPDAVCFSRHIPHASGRILAERFCVIGTLRSNFLLHKKTQVMALSHKPAFDLYPHAYQSLYSNLTFTTLIDRFTSLRFGRISVIKGTYL